MLANCYKRLQKPSKALKALRKAEEINASKNYIKDLSSDIASLEMQAEAQKERRLSLAPKKK
jgi:lipopolysaccharide biosynthesis regulator YciM